MPESLKNPTKEECLAINAALAQHVFGYYWYYYQGNDQRTAWTALQFPSTYQKRFGGTKIDYPHYDDDVDIDVPDYCVDASLMPKMLEECLTKDPQHPMVLHKTLDGYYVWGDIQGDRYQTIQLALAGYMMKLFKIPMIMRTEGKRCKTS